MGRRILYRVRRPIEEKRMLPDTQLIGWGRWKGERERTEKRIRRREKRRRKRRGRGEGGGGAIEENCHMDAGNLYLRSWSSFCSKMFFLAKENMHYVKDYWRVSNYWK